MINTRKVGLHSLSPWPSPARPKHSTGLISTGNVCAPTSRYRIGLTTVLIDPVADDRGGRAEDFAKYVCQLSERAQVRCWTAWNLIDSP
jgi:hypothetical protein